MTTNEELIAEASRLIADCMTYNFGMHNADKLAHEIAPKLVAALAALTSPEPETPELFPGTNAALDSLAVRKAAPAKAFCIEHGNFHAVELGDPTCEFEDGFGEPVEGEQP